MRLSFGQASRSKPGQSEIGDLAWFRHEDGLAQLAVIDGLGHGHEAAAAAQACKEALEKSHGPGLAGQFARCHECCRRTRGAAVSMVEVELSRGLLRWAGVGNVEGLLVREGARERLLLKGGIVGSNLPQLRISELPVGLGDVVILATDGISPDFGQGFQFLSGAQEAAWNILNLYAKSTDDALVWVGRFHE
jgi:negative regulator of sigma-B (phosphoserine phosphatase)